MRKAHAFIVEVVSSRLGLSSQLVRRSVGGVNGSVDLRAPADRASGRSGSSELGSRCGRPRPCLAERLLRQHKCRP